MAKILSAELAEITAIRTGNLKIGSNNQYFTTWDFANSMIHDQSIMGTPGTILSISVSLQLPPLQQLPHHGFFCGEALPSHAHRQERQGCWQGCLLPPCLSQLFAAWSFHAFPWGLGKDLTYVPNMTAVASLQDLSRWVTVLPGLKARLTWGKLNILVIAHLAANENDKLIVEFMKICLSLIVIRHCYQCYVGLHLHCHSRSHRGFRRIYVHLGSTHLHSPVQVKKRQCNAPVGCIRYSQGTGNKMIIQYGEITEDIKTPVLGEVKAQYAPQLKQVGQAVLANTFAAKKKNIMVKVKIVTYRA
ncbi:hypothetical protein BC835DRAFT_1414685 [Cytidiella melzeri]|nr:hypothetical protein BC835DRAFT_1414685 [Cytidiella melzeri]